MGYKRRASSDNDWDSFFEGTPKDFLRDCFAGFLADREEPVPRPYRSGSAKQQESVLQIDSEIEAKYAFEESELVRAAIASLSDSDLVDFKAVWGRAASKDLVQLTKAFASPKRSLPDWSYSNGELGIGAPHENLFEQLVIRDQANYLGSGLFEAFVGLHFLGYQGHDYYFLEIFTETRNSQTRRRPQILLFDHETFGIKNFACDASHLAYFCSLRVAWDAGKLSSDVKNSALIKLKGTIANSWHFDGAFDDVDDGEDFSYEGDAYCEGQAWRCRWLIFLFRQDSVVGTCDLPALFDERFNPALTERLYRKVKDRIDRPPLALMFLWRAFFFSDATWLKRMLKVARASKSRLLRDAGLLVEEFEGGRKTLGKIENIHELRRQFIALDLDPARAAEREVEAAERVLAIEASMGEGVALLAKALVQGDDLVELAWSNLDSLPMHTAIWAHLREMSEMDDAMKRLDWMRADSWHRRNQILSHELEEVIELFLQGLSDEAAQLLVPLWVGMAVHDAREPYPTHDDDDDDDDGEVGMRPAWPLSLRLLRDLARLRPVDIRVAESLTPLLRLTERYDHKRQRVLWVLGAMRYRPALDPIVKIINLVRPTQGNYYLDFGSDDDLTAAAFWALGEIGDKRAGAIVLTKLRKWGPTASRMNGYMARALMEVGDHSAIDTLLRLSHALATENNHDKSVTWMLLAVAKLGAHADFKSKKAWAKRLPPMTEYRDNINVACCIAQLALTGTCSSQLKTFVHRRLTDERSASSYERDHTELALRYFDKTDLPVELVVPFTKRDDQVFRDLAHKALAARDHEVARATSVDLFCLDDRLAEQGDSYLLSALADESTLFPSRLVDSMRRAERNDLRPALINYTERVIQDLPEDSRDLPSDQQYRLVWAVRALLALEINEATFAIFNTLLKHPNLHVKWELMNHLPIDPALEEGMRHVLEENWAWQADTARAWIKKVHQIERGN